MAFTYLFLRDGVGEGQIRYVENEEVKAIEKVLQETKFKNIRLTFVIVCKRINAKFFKTEGQNGGEAAINPEAGTVVDECVTLPDNHDFFLTSQSTRQGTANPVYYNVIRDRSGLSLRELERLTFKLCHLYYNWPGTIKVPSVCQYAHKLAFITGESLHQAPERGIYRNNLFFL